MYKFNKMRTDDCNRVLSLPQIPQRTDAWYSARKTMVTASEVPSILGATIGNSSFDHQVRKRKSGSPSPDSSPAAWGREFEPIAIKIFESKQNVKVYQLGLITHNKYPWLGASPDGITSDGKLIEIKCPLTRAIDDTPPEDYWIQCQIQMETCNIDECWLMVCRFSKEDADAEDGLVDYRLHIINRDREWFKSVYNDLFDFSQLICTISNKRFIPTVSAPVPFSSLANVLTGNKLADWYSLYGQDKNESQDSETKYGHRFSHAVATMSMIRKNEMRLTFESIISQYGKIQNKSEKIYGPLTVNPNLGALRNVEVVYNSVICKVDYLINKSILDIVFSKLGILLPPTLNLENIDWFPINITGNVPIGDNPNMVCSDEFGLLALSMQAVYHSLNDTIATKGQSVGIVLRYAEPDRAGKVAPNNKISSVCCSAISRLGIDTILADAVSWHRKLVADDNMRNIDIAELSVDPTRLCSNNQWRVACKKEALARRDIGLIRGIGRVHRESYINDNIFRWDDPRFYESVNNYQRAIIDSNLSQKISYNNKIDEALLKDALYIDVETVPLCFLHKVENDPWISDITLIGVGWIQGGYWQYRTFGVEGIGGSYQKKMYHAFA